MLPWLPVPRASASQILPPFFILLGAVLQTPLFLLIVISLMSGPAIFELIPLLSQEPN
jgi:Zn-dependent membrane protease YugP